jgi:hypothetical protein
VGSLDVYVHTVLTRPNQAGARPGGVFGEARRVGEQLETLRFCINELMPLLRELRRSTERVSQCTEPIFEATFLGLDGQAKEILRELKLPPPDLENEEQLARLFGAPCAIVGNQLVPLRSVTGDTPGNAVACVAETNYVPRTDGARPVQEILDKLKRGHKRRVIQRLRDQPELNRMATDFLSESKRILDRRRLEDCGPYQVFHRDSDHQLQHCRGSWVLVRGPVANRVENGELFVGLPLVGKKRREWIATYPISNLSPKDFWGPRGGTTGGGMCMGSPVQYASLLAEDFTDAEAVVEWLDAGVILATGRSRFHRRLRDLKQEDHPGRGLAALSRRFRSG